MTVLPTAALILQFPQSALISRFLLALFHYFPHRGIYSDDNEFQNKPNEMCIFIGL